MTEQPLPGEPPTGGLLERTKRFPAGVFLGGPPRLFEQAGRMQLILMLREGLYPTSKVLDIGCGCLRGGYWLINFLAPGGYCGVEPNRAMVEAGLAHLLDPGVADAQRPRFDHNAEFDFSVFDETFDFVVARSIWTHAAKQHIERMLDGFVAHTSPGAVFFASYMPPSLLKPDYKGDTWVGKSHESDAAGIARHSLKWIESACAARGLSVEVVTEEWLNFGGQTWLRIRRA